MLSHLNTECNGQDVDYVMQTSLDHSIDRRFLTQPEIDILCEMGYEIEGCNGCYISAFSEILNYGNDNNYERCCVKDYYTCVGSPISISYEDLLCNDFSNDVDLTITDYYIQSSSSSLAINDDTDTEFIITPSAQGRFTVYYTIQGCDCKMQNASFEVLVGPCLDCENTDPCDNLSCTNGFEDFATYFQNSGLNAVYQSSGYWVYENSFQNSPDLCVENNGNKYLQLYFSACCKEAIALPLQEAVEPGCLITVSLRASSTSATAGILLYGSTSLPCHPSDASVNLGCVLTDCNNQTPYNPSCLGEIPISNTVSQGGCPNEANLGDYTLSFLENYPLEYIIITPNVQGIDAIFIDDIIVTKNCSNAEFTLEGECINEPVQFTSTYDISGVTHEWFLGDGGTSADVNPQHTYTAPGDYTITHTVTDECGNVTTEERTITIIDCMASNCLCETGINIDAGEGTSTNDIPQSELPITVNGGCISISGKLIIEGEYTWNGVDVRMNPGAEIEVDGWGNRLNILNNTVLHGCETMWKGIVVGGSAQLDMQNSEIRDAQFAITPRDNARIKLLENDFIANNVGIYTAPSDESQSFKVLSDDIAWSGNDFIGSNVFLTPYTGQTPLPGIASFAGMWLHDISGISEPMIEGEVNTIEGSLYGIFVDRGVNAKLYSVEINNLVSEGDEFAVGIRLEYSDKIGIKSASIGDCASAPPSNLCIENETLRVGIEGHRSGAHILYSEVSATKRGIDFRYTTNKKITISDNKSITASEGIKILSFNNDSDYKTLIINNNDPINAFLGITLSSSDAVVDIKGNVTDFDPIVWDLVGGAGIRVLSSDGEITVRYNTSNFGGVLPDLNVGAGLVLSTSQNCFLLGNTVNGSAVSKLNRAIGANSSPNNAYCCNKIYNSRLGASFIGMCNDSEFRNTKFNNHRIGIQLYQSIIGTQGNTGNNWINSNSVQYDAQYDGDPIFVDQSFFTADPGLIPFGLDKVNVVGGDASSWFLIAGDGSTCSNDCGIELLPWEQLMEPDNELTTADINASLNLNTNDPVVKGLKWEAQQNLYTKLNQHAYLISMDNAVSSFYTEALNNNLSDFYTLKQGLRSIPHTGISGTNYWALKNSLDSIYNNTDSLWLVWELANPQEKLQIETQIENDYDLIGDIFDDLKVLETQLEVSKMLAIDDLIQENDAIVDNEIFESNEKSINNIFLLTVAKGIHKFNSVQKGQIDAIAGQCPFIGGTSVYRARMLQSFYNPIDYDDELLCQSTNRRNEVIDEALVSNNSAYIYPNPANDRLNIQLNNALDTDGRLQIFDLTGNNVISQKLTEGMTKFQIISIDLSPGIYFYKIQDVENQLISSGKVVISR